MVTNDTRESGEPERLGFEQAQRLFSSVYGDEADLFADEDVTRVGPYLLGRELGAGGGGTVYEGVRLGSERSVAVKILRRPLDEGRATRRAYRELELLEGTRCPNVPRLHEFGVHEGRFFMACDLIDGRPLDAYCDDHELDLRARVRLLAETCRVVQHVHERGILHRDIKPGNLLVDESGIPHLIDLGLATLDHDDPFATETDGRPVGTYAFMAPEQARGERELVSTRSDVFGLGATAWFVLTGTTPFDVDADTPEVIRRVGQDAPRTVRSIAPHLPRSLAAILDAAVHPDPTRRIATAQELAEELRRWLENEPVLSQSPSWLQRQWLAARRRPGAWSAATVLIALTLGALAFGLAQQAQAAALDAREDGRLEASTLFSTQMVQQLHDMNFQEGWKFAMALDCGIEAGYFDPARAFDRAVLFDADEFRAALEERPTPFSDAELDRVVDLLARARTPQHALLARMVEATFPDTPDAAAGIAAWVGAVLDAEGIEGDDLVANLEFEIRLRDDR